VSSVVHASILAAVSELFAHVAGKAESGRSSYGLMKQISPQMTFALSLPLGVLIHVP
jgi:hypothetical protein